MRVRHKLRQDLCLGLMAIAFAVAASPTVASDYPSRPVRMIVALGTGSVADILARTLAPKLSEQWKQPVVVENRPGGAGAVAGTILLQAPADGHTLMVYSDGHAVNAALNANLPYDTLRDIARVSQLAAFSPLLLASPAAGVASARELIALAKAKPGSLSFGSAGIGGGLHFCGEMFNIAAGIDAVHVPYKSAGDALTDLIAGRIQFMFAPAGLAMPHIKSGRLSALGIASSQRSALMPELPTVAEAAALPKFEYELWTGLFAPGKTPPGVLTIISRDVDRIMSLPDVKELYAKQGFSYRRNTPEEFDLRVRAEIERLRQVAKAAAISVQ